MTYREACTYDFELTEFGVIDATERLRRYRRYVYEAGAVSRPDKAGCGITESCTDCSAPAGWIIQ